MRSATWLIVSLIATLWATAAAAQTTYEVRPGDMLGSIAAQFDCSIEQLREWNDLSGDTIYAGQELTVYEGAGGSSSSGYLTYTVQPGDTMGGIAARHDVSINDLVSWNNGLDPDRIRAGQELSIRGYGRQQRRITYVVESGDFVGSIAARFDVSIDDIARWNGNLDPDRVRIGQELTIWVEGPEQASESVGRANGGELVHGEQLPPHRGYTIRNADLAWGTNETIGAMLDGFDHMQRTWDSLPRVPVHDLSRESGGHLSGHRSHQSGRDADIGFYYDSCGSECSWRVVDADELDEERQWSLLRYWIDNDLVEYVFIDYRLQRALYEHAEALGASDAQLRSWFQYPRGRDSASGLIRHEPNHADHLHVRFACPPDDDRCR